MDAERKRFEEWAREYGMLPRSDKADIALTWDAWQAALSAPAGEAVAWAVYDARGVLINVCRHYSNAESETRAWNEQGRVPESDKPFRIVPLYASPPPAGERAAVVEECARVCDGPHPAGSGLDSYTCAALGNAIRSLSPKPARGEAGRG